MKIVRREPGKGYLDSDIWVPKEYLNVEGTKRALTFEFSRGTEARISEQFRETEHHLVLPREFWKYKRSEFDIVDCRPSSYEQVDITSHITLDYKDRNDFTQRVAVRSMEEARGGVLQLACGKGKTVCALELISRLKVPALIVVDNTTLLDQWAEAIEQFLDVPGGVGRIEGGVFDWKHPVVLATYQTLAKQADTLPEEVRRYFGVIIWDEGHHIGAETFSKTANLFYGRRYCLTATPERKDGMHIIHELHVGPVLYKNLRQELRPHINFRETGVSLNTDDPEVVRQVYDARGELHYGLLSGFLGRQIDRLSFILNRVTELLEEGRKILVLSNSIEELTNLLTLWSGFDSFYADIPVPTMEELDPPEPEGTVPLLLGGDRETVVRNLTRFLSFLPDEEEQKLPLKTVKQMEKAFKLIQKRLERTPSLIPERQKWELGKTGARLVQDRAARRLNLLLEERRANYLTELLSVHSIAGIMIYDVPRAVRLSMIRDKQITFAIGKYGREGLDSQDLDTVIILEPGSQKGWMQQVMGRALRMKPEKKEPLIEIFEDDINLMRVICHQLRKHLRKWPLDEGGPYEFSIIRAAA